MKAPVTIKDLIGMWLGLHKIDIWYFYDYICIICIISDLLNKCQTMSFIWHYYQHGSIYVGFSWKSVFEIMMGWVGLWGFLWWAPSVKRKDHHRVSSGWSSTWFHSNTGVAYLVHNMSRSNYIWGLTILSVSLLFSANNILAGLWLNCVSSVEITLFLLANILLQLRALFQC